MQFRCKCIRLLLLITTVIVSLSCCVSDKKLTESISNQEKIIVLANFNSNVPDGTCQRIENLLAYTLSEKYINYEFIPIYDHDKLEKEAKGKYYIILNVDLDINWEEYKVGSIVFDPLLPNGRNIRLPTACSVNVDLSLIKNKMHVKKYNTKYNDNEYYGWSGGWQYSVEEEYLTENFINERINKIDWEDSFRTFLSFYNIQPTNAQKQSIRNRIYNLTNTPGSLTIFFSYTSLEHEDENKIKFDFFYEIGKAIVDKIGLKANYLSFSHDAILDGTDSKEYDCILTDIPINPSMQTKYNFTKPYIQNAIVIIVPKNSKYKINSPKDLTGLKVAYNEYETSGYYITQLYENGLKIIPYKSDIINECFNQMMLGNVDAIVTDIFTAYKYINNFNNQFEIVWQDEIEQYGICTKKDNDALTDIMNEVLDELFNDGTLSKISKNTFGIDIITINRQTALYE